MRPSHALVAACLALAPALVASSGCRHTATATEVPAPPDEILRIDELEAALNRYALLDEKAPAREGYRRAMLAFLVHYVATSAEAGDERETEAALKYAAALWTPAELRTAGAQPELARAAHRLYRRAARRGAENPSFLALAIEQRFGDPTTREKAVEEWQVLEDWVVKNGPFSGEPLLRHEELEHSLELVAAVFPSPFVTRRLTDLYVARYEAAKGSRNNGRDAGTISQRRLEITGYLIMRLYLRADDLPGAEKALERVHLDMPVAKLHELMRQAMSARRSAGPLLTFAEQFVPEDEADPTEPYVIQGWGIVDVLSRRAVARHPKDPYAHFLRARTLAEAGLVEASIAHLRQTIALKEDLFTAWSKLAVLEQRNLERMAERDPEGASRRLVTIEDMHARASRLWKDRPIRPGLPEAFFTVAEGLYHAGEVDRAKVLLEKSVGIEPVPNALYLLGTIALKQSHLDQAQKRYEALANLSYPNETAQLHWEARARQQLGEIALRRGDTGGSARHIRIALRHTNDLLALPNGEDARAERLVDRGRLLFYLGEVDLAMSDFARAEELAPDSVKVYADPLLSVVSHGYYREARTIFHRAMARGDLSDSLKLYFSLWVRELALRQGEGPDKEAEAFLKDYVGDAWGKRLAQHARGEIPFATLLEGATSKSERTEAYFYEGLRQWRAGHTAEGKKLMKKVLESGMLGFFEFDMAQTYLQLGDLPRSATPPMTAQATRAKG